MRNNTKGLTEAIRMCLVDGPQPIGAVYKELEKTWPHQWIKTRLGQLAKQNRNGKQYIEILEDDGNYRARLTPEGQRAALRDVEKMKRERTPKSPSGGLLYELIHTDEDSGVMLLRGEDGSIVEARALVLR